MRKTAPETAEALSALAGALGVDPGGVPADVLRRCQAAAARLRGDRWQQQLSLGFETGDTSLDEAGKLLRALYIADLRELQTRIDHLIVQAQEYTAQPRTDAKLGKVGR